MNGKLIIISAPSGAGKTTIVKALLESDLRLEFSVSATTRKMRSGEKEGIDYYFIGADEFRQRIQKGEFIEWEEVYKDHYYGTLKSEIDRIREKDCNVLFDVDVMGGLNLKMIFGKEALSLFIRPPSVKELEKRLTLRGTDTPDKIAMRVKKAEEEMLTAKEFDFVVINDTLDKAVKEAYDIISGFINTGNA
jgi:guanylate kinase